MGSKKSGFLEKIKEGDQIGKEAIDTGGNMEREGDQIKAILDSIDTSMDTEDATAVESAETGYSSDFQNAFAEEVDTKVEDMSDVETEAISESQSELEKVNDAADKLREAGGISDIGRENADSAVDRMSSSAAEYQEYIDEANSVLEDTQSETENLKSSIENIFG